MTELVSPEADGLPRKPTWSLAACVGVVVGLLLLGAIVLMAPLWRSPPYVRPGSRSLLMIIDAQERFRAEDLDRNGIADYGNLAALATAGLLDPELATGKKYGYLFAVSPSPSSPQFFWMAIANPAHPEIDDRSFVTNHLGRIYYRHGAMSLDPTCEIPSDARSLDQ